MRASNRAQCRMCTFVCACGDECVRYHSSAPCSSWQMAPPTSGPGVCAYCLGISGARGQKLPGVDCQVSRSVLLTHTHTHVPAAMPCPVTTFIMRVIDFGF